jgi:hypothetical protein
LTSPPFPKEFSCVLSPTDNRQGCHLSAPLDGKE